MEIDPCKSCGSTSKETWPSISWFPGEMLCEDCHGEESDEIKEEEEVEYDFYEELRRSHMYSWCIV